MTYPDHPTWGKALGGKPFEVDGRTFYAYRHDVLQYVWADPTSAACVWDVSWKNGNPRGYEGGAPKRLGLPIRKTKQEAAHDALEALPRQSEA